MKYLQIILNLPINQRFTYSYIPPEKEDIELLPEIGKRAEIMFGNKKTSGFIIEIWDKLPENFTFPQEKIKPIKRVIDKEPIFGKELLDIAQWISHFYLCSLGEAIFAMIPSGRRESSAGGFSFENEIIGAKNILSNEQQKAVDEIFKNSKGYHYLYGPTGSGKTEVFLSLTEKYLNEGKSVIYLVPEISLTGQVAQSVTNRFGDTAAIIHSGLTPSQKLQQWNKIKHNEAKVIVGARSAIFAPTPNLGLVIIDEEHDGSYKSANNPRYHARQVAMYRCAKLGIPLVMGSATPSVEAWHEMNKKNIIRHNLSVRLAGGAPPKISYIDLNYFPKDNCISQPLEEEINKCLLEHKQTILFLNRRGFTHFFRCNSCGYELICKNCSVSLTYHKNINRLRCHYCGWSITPPQSCPKCGSIDIGSSGFGTEYIEAEAKAKFPNAKIIRLDTDIITDKKELLSLLNDFKNHKYDIMLGTQMVAKGLNFPNLKLVGVIMADSGLHMPDFRAGERTFSLITQVSGRAGRYFPDGKVLVQTFNPRNEPIFYAIHNKINEFYNYEINQRELLDFPPFSRIIRLVFRSFSKKEAFQTSLEASKILQKLAPNGAEIIGPAECPIEKINSNYRYQILLKGSSILPLQDIARKLMTNYKHNQNVYIEYDVDPVSLL